MLFNKWDEQIREAEQATEGAATAARSIIDCVNENFHRENLIAEITLGYLPNAQQLETD